MKNNGEKFKKAYGIISILIFIAIFLFCTFAIGPRLISSISNPESFSEFINENSFSSVLSFLLIQIFQVFFALIPGEPIEIFAGYAFGAVFGTLLCLIGVAAASVAIFTLTKQFGKKFTLIVFDEKKIKGLSFLKNEKNVALLLFILYFIPGTPKDLLTYFAGLTKIKTRHFILITTIARIPSVTTSTLVGANLMQENYLMSIIIFVATALISLIGIIAYKLIIKHKHNKNNDNIDFSENI